MSIVFLKFQPKNTQIRHFWSQIQAFLFLQKSLQLHQFEGADFKYDSSCLKFYPENTQRRHSWSQIQTFLLFYDILQLDKFKRADFKSGNSFLKILAQKYPIKAFLVKNTQKWHFWSQIQAFLFLHKILELGKLEGTDFKYVNSFFKILAQKYPNKAFLVPNLVIFLFLRNFAIRQIGGS